jgi:hypothetical protein
MPARLEKANDFTNYIASGGGRDLMRPPISQEMYSIPRDRVIGSATTRVCELTAHADRERLKLADAFFHAVSADRSGRRDRVRRPFPVDRRG